MDNDPIDEVRRQRGMRNFGIIIGLVILMSVFFFLWGFINRGTISITGMTPFEVEVHGGETFECAQSPCEISQKRGHKNLIITKEGHKNIITSAKVRLWRTVDVEVEFSLSPEITEAEALPEQTGEVLYELIEDNETFNQKLVESKDSEKRTIVYFQNKVDNAQIFGNKDYALIASEESYFVDIRLKQRQRLNGIDLRDIKGGKISKSGHYFIYSEENSTNLKLLKLEDNSIKELLLMIEIPHTAWIYNDGMVFVTKQKYSLQGNDQEGNQLITPMEGFSSTKFTFGIYNPDTDSYSIIESFSGITEGPDDLIPTINGRTIYFQSGGEYFKIEL